jgi:hypothetical protein
VEVEVKSGRNESVDHCIRPRLNAKVVVPLVRRQFWRGFGVQELVLWRGWQDKVR